MNVPTLDITFQFLHDNQTHLYALLIDNKYQPSYEMRHKTYIKTEIEAQQETGFYSTVSDNRIHKNNTSLLSSMYHHVHPDC